MLSKPYCIFLSGILLFFLLLSENTQLDAQSPLGSKSNKAIAYYRQADNFRVRGQYDQAITLLQKAVRKDDGFVEAYLLLGVIYVAIDHLTLAEKHYQQAIDLSTGNWKYADAYLSIAEVLITLEKYREAKEKLAQYLDHYPKSQRKQKYKHDRATLLLSQANYAIDHIDARVLFDPTPLSNKVNQFVMQYFPVLTADESTLLYTKRDGNTRYDDEDIMISVKDENDNWTTPRSISPYINSELNEGTCAISADGRRLVFTSCQGRKGYGSCDLFISHKRGDQWSAPVNMGAVINSSAWESQPSLSADGRMLYFVSDRKGGLGGRDIWSSEWVNGNWTSPLNLGTRINTSYEEVSPFIHASNKALYFASDGLPGFGGFDLYCSELDTMKHWQTPYNIGYPINRGTDQMSLVITADGSKGFYSDNGVNATGGELLSEIREFDIADQLRVKYVSGYVSGIVTDRKTHIPLQATIQLYDISTNELIGEVSSDSVSGEYLMVLTEGGSYGLYFERRGYVFQSQYFDFQSRDMYKPLPINVQLEQIAKGAVSVLNNVFFEHDSYALSDQSLTELNKVVDFLRHNSVKLEIGGYTDSSGTKAYNLDLSQKRAKAVYNYLVKQKNISSTLLTYKGYGQDHSKSSDELNAARRIEFKIL